ncbi:helix-turn-helix transcriptional regulator [Paenibacillus ginsengarvi]|uniref:AraC family transcriptional regulator n=1 Tax=Paenibacillus ginsengarvi TaxID=400777 RepID=A0A3B0AWQ4_9BACL|nr:AraC family transcriptional regulator [Paenibacillus ginsengarvi]RKN65155.1 AraC family transcriptional regulator [Paenibacillus ginsengarvi]
MDFRLEAGGRSFTIDHVTTNLMAGRDDAFVKRHVHPVFHVMYILEGKGMFTVGDMASVVEPGHLFVIHPNEPHQFHFGTDGPLTNLESTFILRNKCGEPAEMNLFDMIEESRAIEIGGALRSAPLTVPPRFRPMLEEGYRRILALYDIPLLKSHFAVTVAELLTRVETIVASIVQAEKTPNTAEETVERAKRFLLSNWHRPVTLAETAQSVHVTPNYLCRLFKERTGETPMGFLQTARLREAGHLLAFTDLPVYTIAEKLGYEEPSYFARLFRRVYGESPQAYRKLQISYGQKGL